jgi:hypothetical protein
MTRSLSACGHGAIERPHGTVSKNEKENLMATIGTFKKDGERKEPIHDAAHVRNAIARFGQVEGVTDSERDAAWRRIKSAAKKYNVEISGEPSGVKA